MENTDPLPQVHKQDERILAAMAHGAILIPIYGIVIPAIIWITQKDKSRYVSFQSLQALIFHLMLLFLYVIGMLCYFLSFFGMLGGMTLTERLSSDWMAALVSLFPFAVLGGFACVGLFFVIYGAVGAIISLVGKDFHYLVIGKILESRLEVEPA